MRAHFLLVGNAPYTNRGCEAIARGTVSILRRAFGPGARFTIASYGEPELIAAQARAETDPAIEHLPLAHERFSVPWVLHQLNKRLGARTAGEHYALRRAVRSAAAALEIGGDNYSLDYGVPRQFLALDEFLLRSGVPVAIWGASVGPFDKEPEFAGEVFAHLRKLNAIYVRESASRDYLAQNRVTENVRLVADPAFAMEPAEPPSGSFPPAAADGEIGLNLSALMARYATGGDTEAWKSWCVEAVAGIVRTTGRPVLLVPHVFNRRDPLNDDGRFLREVAQGAGKRLGMQIPVLGELTAPQIKWVIGRCEVFAGARTHSTIAAISSRVPTLSLAYSIKARGLNQDIFGSQDYCLPAREMTPERLAERLAALLNAKEQVRELLERIVPDLVRRAWLAGDLLREHLAG